MKTNNYLEEYRGFKIGDIVRNIHRVDTLQRCEIVEILESRLPLILVIENNEEHFIPVMDMKFSI